MFETKTCACADAVMIVHALCVGLVVVCPFLLPAWTLKYQLVAIPLILLAGFVFDGCVLTLVENRLRDHNPHCRNCAPSDVFDSVVGELADPADFLDNTYGHAFISRLIAAVLHHPLTQNHVQIVIVSWWFVTFVLFLLRS